MSPQRRAQVRIGEEWVRDSVRGSTKDPTGKDAGSIFVELGESAFEAVQELILRQSRQ
jgi:hypothetical protein